MPFTVIRQPANTAPVRSPVRLVLQDMEHLQLAGTPCRWSLTFYGASSPGDTVTIRYGDVSIVFTAAATALANGTSYATGGTSAAAAAAFAAGAKLNYFLARDFIIVASGATITFTARENGAAYQPGTVTGTGAAALQFQVLIPGTDRVYRAQHHVGLALWVEDPYDTGSWHRMPDQAGHPDADSEVEFDLAQWLRPWLMPDEVPYNLAAPMLATQSMKRFYAQYWSRYATADNAQPQKAVYTGPTTRAWLAGHERADKPRWDSWYQTVANAPFRFLTARGRTVPREVTRAERHTLTWHVGYQYATAPVNPVLTLQVQVQFTSGQATNFIDVLSLPANSFPRYHNVIWPAGWNMLGMDTLLTGHGFDPTTAVAYTLRIVNSEVAGPVSEAYRFELVMPDYQDVHIQFFNAMGAWESVRFSGQWERTAKPEHTAIQRPLGYKDDTNPVAAANSGVHIGTQDSLLLHSAINPVLEHQALLDMLTSPAIRLVDSTRARFLPVRIAESEEVPVQTRGTEQEHLNQLAITLLVDDPQPVRNLLP